MLTLKVGRGWHAEVNLLFAQNALGTNQPLRNGCLLREKRARNLADAEATNELQRHGHPRLSAKRRMTRQEEQPQLVVVHGRQFVA